RDVVQRAAAGLAEVPRRVDRLAAGRVETLGLVLLMVDLEGAAADGPGKLADRPALDQLTCALQLRSQDLARRRDQAEPVRRRQFDQLVSLRDRRAHRLVDVPVLPC